MATAELEGVASEAAPETINDRPQVEATPAVEQNGQAEKPTRSRDASGKFVSEKTDDQLADEAIIARAKELKAQREGAPKPEAKALKATPSEPGKIDDALYAKAEEAGLTRYEIDSLGDSEKIDAEIARLAKEREAAKPEPEPTKPEAKPAEEAKPNTEQKTTTAPELDSVRAALSEMKDLDPAEFDPQTIERDKSLRGALNQLLDVFGQVQKTSREEIDRLQESARQDEERRQAIAARETLTKFDDALAKLGSEFEPVFGKGKWSEKLPSGYLRTRDELLDLTLVLQAKRPDRDMTKAAEAAAAALYPDLHRRQVEKRIREAAEASGRRASPPSGSNDRGEDAEHVPGADGYTPKQHRLARNIERKQQTGG